MEQMIGAVIPWGINGTARDDPYTDVASAVVAQAAKDYIKILRKLWKKDITVQARRELFLGKLDLESFFHSAWYEMLTDWIRIFCSQNVTVQPWSRKRNSGENRQKSGAEGLSINKRIQLLSRRKKYMKQGRALPEVLKELQHQNNMKQDFIGPAQAFMLEPDGRTFCIRHQNTGAEETFGTTDLFHRQVGSTLGIPAKYYDLMRQQKPELLAENVNSWFADREQSYMIRSMDYGSGRVARALLSDRYRRIDNLEVAAAVLPLFAGKEEMEVVSTEVSPNRLYLKIVNKRLEMEVVPGDYVQAGVVISNSEVGLGAVSVQPLVYRLVCTNGMVVNDFGERRAHVGRAVKALEDSFQLYSDETMEAEDKAFMLKLRDTTMGALEEARFAQIVGRLRKVRRQGSQAGCRM